MPPNRHAFELADELAGYLLDAAPFLGQLGPLRGRVVRASAAGRAAAPRISGRRPDRARGGSRRRNRRRVFGPKPARGRCPAIGRGVPGRVAVSHCPAEAACFHSSVGAEPIRGVVARIVTGPHDANRQDPHLPMRYDTGQPRAVIRLRISQSRTTSLPYPAGLRARRPSPMMNVYLKSSRESVFFSSQGCQAIAFAPTDPRCSSTVRSSTRRSGPTA